MRSQIEQLARRPGFQAAAWAAINGLLVVLFTLLLILDQAAHASGA